MTEIQRLLTETIDDLNIREKRDNKPRFSVSFIRKHPGLFIGMYVAWFATLAVMLQSETLVDSVWLLVVLFVILNAFFFFDVAPRYRFEDIDVLDFHDDAAPSYQLLASDVQTPSHGLGLPDICLTSTPT